MKRQPKPPALPASHLQRIEALGLRTIAYLDYAIECASGVKEWAPRDIIGADGKTAVLYREMDRNYGFSGWEPWHDGMFGGRYRDIHSALAWIERAIDIRAGRETDFLGR